MPGMKPANAKQPGTPIWLWIVVIAAGVGLGLGLRPLIQGGLGGSGATSQAPAVRCPGPDGSELALSEFITSSLSGTDVTYSRSYRLERPGQAALQFDGANGDKDSAPINCANVQFGPGARISFSRGRGVSVVELVGPNVHNWDASGDKGLTALILEPRWKLGLKLDDYVAGAPSINEDGKGGRVELRRIAPNPAFPERLIFTTADGGVSWTFDRAGSLRGF